MSLVLTFQAQAESWTFSEKISVAPVNKPNIFQHLDATARKSMAISEKLLAIVWEDNRSGEPQTYIAFKFLEEEVFSEPILLSTNYPAYAPTILALGNSMFLAGWEQNNQVMIRSVSSTKLGPPAQLSRKESGQIALATFDGHDIFTAWSERTGRYTQIMTKQIKIDDKGKINSGKPVKPVDSKPPENDQSSPALAMNGKGVTVAWEDRRLGHTALFFSHASNRDDFKPPRLINEVFNKSDMYGRGSGATRVALSTVGNDHLVAVWMDKRNYQTAYDIYVAFSQNGGQSFGKNEIVQDAFAKQYSQWHPAITGNITRQIVVAWDDDREGSSNIWMTWMTKEGWSMNFSPPPASFDDKLHTSPSIVLDEHGKLHLTWLEQGKENSPGRVMYAIGGLKN